MFSSALYLLHEAPIIPHSKILLWLCFLHLCLTVKRTCWLLPILCSYTSAQNRFLLCTGDVERNPGPRTSALASEKSLKSIKTKMLRIVHLYVRSLIRHLDDIALLTASQCLDVLVVSETWLDDGISDGEIFLPGYSVTRFDRNRRGGGVAVFCANYLNCSILSQDILASGLESSWVTVASKLFTSPLALGCFYRPPVVHSLSLFMMALSLC